MCGAGAVDVLQVDASRCAGISEWVRAAAAAAARGPDVSVQPRREPASAQLQRSALGRRTRHELLLALKRSDAEVWRTG